MSALFSSPLSLCLTLYNLSTVVPTTASPQRRQTKRISPSTTTTTARPRPSPRRGTPRPFSKISLPQSSSTIAPKSQFISRHKQYDDLAPDYDDYYAEPVDIPLSGKVRIHNDGYIECLDIGNFPHPFACRKFISCAKMENGHLLGWEYTCPKGLSFDPIGGICNWSSGLGCKEWTLQGTNLFALVKWDSTSCINSKLLGSTRHGPFLTIVWNILYE